MIKLVWGSSFMVTQGVHLVAVLLAVSACESKASPSAAVTAGAQSVTPAVAKPGADSESLAKNVASSGATCPAGRWRYDYSDQALEVMVKSTANANVIKEEGEFVCDISSGKSGTIECDTQNKPVENVVETQQAGLPMTVRVKFEGKATTKFKLLEDGRMQVTDSDTSQFKLQTQMSLAGRTIPFPADKLINVFGEKDAILQYKCEDGKLQLKPTLKDVETSWQQLSPVK